MLLTQSEFFEVFRHFGFCLFDLLFEVCDLLVHLVDVDDLFLFKGIDVTRDIQIEVVPVPFEKMSELHPSESSESIRARVVKARAIQETRFASYEGIHCNAQMTSKLLREYAVPDTAGLSLLKIAMQRLNLSARAYDRILKVSRTIADLDGSSEIESRHIAEAINYRNLDRETWGM